MSEFNHRKWFKKQYLEEGHTEDKVVAATKDRRIEITKKQMERLHNGEVVHLSNGSVLSFVKEGHTEDKDKELQQIKRFDQLSDDDKLKLAKIQAMMDRERSLREDDDNMTPEEIEDFKLRQAVHRLKHTGRTLDDERKAAGLNEASITMDAFNRMESMVDIETYRKFTDSLDDLLDDWYMEGFDKNDVVAYMEVIIPSN